MRPVPALVSALAVLSSLGIAGCVAPPPEAAPPPQVVALPAPPLAAPVTLGDDWRDWPLTPGTWRYGTGSARFGEADGLPVLGLACDRASRIVTLSRPGVSGDPTLTIRTTSATRALTATAMTRPDSWPPTALEVRMAATDPLLDTMAFSRGRFTVEQPGKPPLVIPAYAEIGRVIEDCRG